MKDLTLKKYCQIINEKTLTQKEKAKELNRSVRTVKQQTADKKLKPLIFKSNVLYLKEK